MLGPRDRRVIGNGRPCLTAVYKLYASVDANMHATLDPMEHREDILS